MIEYASPFSNRYGSKTMREIWSEKTKRLLWREAWINILTAQFDVNMQGTQSYRSYNQSQFDEAIEEEKRTKHDLVAERNIFSRKLPKRISDKIHIGITSSDIEDYADEEMISFSLQELKKLYLEFVDSLIWACDSYSEIPVIGRTHLQPAEPTILGYRFLWYLQQSFKTDVMNLHVIKKGMHGAVGTNANLELIGADNKMFEITEAVFQTYPRNNELRIAGVLAELAAVIHKMAFDVRIMTMEGLLEETKGPGQYGSSAMPHKNNPITSEKLCGLARLIPGYYQSIWTYSANSLLERTLDDSCVRRIVLPELFLCMSEMLISSSRLIKNMRLIGGSHTERVIKSWKSWLPSRVLTMLRRDGGDYEVLYAKVEKLAESLDSPEEFIDMTLKNPKLYPYPYKSNNPERLISLDHITTYVKQETSKWKTIIKTLKG